MNTSSLHMYLLRSATWIFESIRRNTPERLRGSFKFSWTSVCFILCSEAFSWRCRIRDILRWSFCPCVCCELQQRLKSAPTLKGLPQAWKCNFKPTWQWTLVPPPPSARLPIGPGIKVLVLTGLLWDPQQGLRLPTLLRTHRDSERILSLVNAGLWFAILFHTPKPVIAAGLIAAKKNKTKHNQLLNVEYSRQRSRPTKETKPDGVWYRRKLSQHQWLEKWFRGGCIPNNIFTKIGKCTATTQSVNSSEEWAAVAHLSQWVLVTEGIFLFSSSERARGATVFTVCRRLQTKG